jgi:hypothetical protein
MNEVTMEQKKHKSNTYTSGVNLVGMLLCVFYGSLRSNMKCRTYSVFRFFVEPTTPAHSIPAIDLQLLSVMASN